ncbi:MAG: tRNA1(Val) (adenine(37)-N6)-methyltransferase [Selenomonadaceae bacterium]|nr:tRNA1(Val) (adenine(37)-N6)-methyltransferase [Selenomonadaceae bacterium]
MIDLKLNGDSLRIDDLMRSGRKIIQNANEFCFSMDSVLLAHFPKFKRKYKVLDLGTGTGVIPLLIADEVTHINAIELNSTMAEIAKRNVELNDLGDKISVVEGDYRKIRDYFKVESFDLVLANPPYRAIGSGAVNEIKGVATARHEFTATLEDVVTAARFALKYHGIFCMIHITERLCEIVDALHRHQFEMKRLRLIQPKSQKPPNLMLIEAMVGGAAGSLKIEPPLIAHNDDGTYSEEIMSIYNSC